MRQEEMSKVRKVKSPSYAGYEEKRRDIGLRTGERGVITQVDISLIEFYH